MNACLTTAKSANVAINIFLKCVCKYRGMGMSMNSEEGLQGGETTRSEVRGGTIEF